MSKESIEHFLTALPAIITACIAIYLAWRKTPTEIVKTRAETQKTEAEAHKTEAESENIHAQIADRWAEHVVELQTQVRDLVLDVAQVRRDNEKYRQELSERDEIISDLKDWAERLINQLRIHAPNVPPEQFYQRRRSTDKT
jgi:peptidoglycan hydrolase CwlO-like protein